MMGDDRELARAASDHAQAAAAHAVASRDRDRQRDRVVRIDPRAPRVRRCYTRLLTLARRQLGLQDDHGAENFLEKLKATADLPGGGALSRAEFERGMERPVVRKEREQKRADAARKAEARREAERLRLERLALEAAEAEDSPEEEEDEDEDSGSDFDGFV